MTGGAWAKACLIMGAVAVAAYVVAVVWVLLRGAH